MPSLPEIGRSRVFDGLTDADRQAWLEESTTRSLRRGQPLARQGEAADCFYLVEAGALKLVQVTEDGRELIVRFVGPGEPFGGVVALDGATFPVTALAVEPTGVRAWPRETLGRLLPRFPQVRVNLMREMTAHMTDALTRVREMATARVGQRLAHTILRLMRQSGRPTADGILIQHALTRQEFAELAGTTLYTVSRTLSKWQSEGILGASGRRLLVRSPKRLEALTQSEDE